VIERIHTDLLSRVPETLRRALSDAKVSIEGNCVKMVVERGVNSLLDERGLLHGASVSSIAIVAAEIAISALLEQGRYVAMNSFTSFIKQVSEPAMIVAEACIENHTLVHALVSTVISADGVEVAKNTTLFLKLQGEE